MQQPAVVYHHLLDAKRTSSDSYFCANPSGQSVITDLTGDDTSPSGINRHLSQTCHFRVIRRSQRHRRKTKLNQKTLGGRKYLFADAPRFPWQSRIRKQLRPTEKV